MYFSGVVKILAGSGLASWADGTGTLASFYSPSGVLVDTVGNVYFGDMNNRRIRRLSSAGEPSVEVRNIAAALVVEY